MVRLTIIPGDSVVGIDGVFRSVSMTGIDPAIHAVQFDDDISVGEIEYRQRSRSNERITDRLGFEQFVARWTAAVPPPPSPPTAEELAEKVRLQAIRDDALRQELLAQLDTATNVQISAFIDNQVTDLQSARTMFKRILLMLAIR